MGQIVCTVIVVLCGADCVLQYSFNVWGTLWVQIYLFCVWQVVDLGIAVLRGARDSVPLYLYIVGQSVDKTLSLFFSGFGNIKYCTMWVSVRLQVYYTVCGRFLLHLLLKCLEQIVCSSISVLFGTEVF